MTAFDPAQLIARLAPFKATKRCWIAFSGGLDSTVLLSAAASVREALPGVLHAIHLDHGLHPESCAWVAHCQSCCERLSIPLHVRHLHLQPHPGDSIEAVAREARYRTFSSLLDPGDLLLTAHNRDDQAETLLLALLRGSGVHGLAAIPFEMRLGAGHLIRPLLNVTRSALADYARTEGLTWIDDPSNAVTALDRNYLRHQVLPRLRERWPALATTLSRSAGHCAEAARLVDNLSAQTLPGLAGKRPGTLNISELNHLERPLQKAVLRLWLRQRGYIMPDTRHLLRILDEVLPARQDASPLVAWPGCEIRRYRQDLFAMPPLPQPLPLDLEIIWSVGNEMATLELSQGLGRLEWFPAPGENTSGQAVVVRFGLTGLRCRHRADRSPIPFKKLCQALGIPAWWRPYVPLIFAGDSLIAIAGVCSCQGDEPMGEFHWRGHPWDSLLV